MIKTVTESSPQWKLMLSFLLNPHSFPMQHVKGLTSLSISSVVYRNLKG